MVVRMPAHRKYLAATQRFTFGPHRCVELVSADLEWQRASVAKTRSGKLQLVWTVATSVAPKQTLEALASRQLTVGV